MTIVSSHRSLRVLAAVCCSLGVMGIVSGGSATLTILTLAGLSSAALLMPALFTTPLRLHARAQPHHGVIR